MLSSCPSCSAKEGEYLTFTLCAKQILKRVLSWEKRLKFIYSTTKAHSLGLAKFVALYKTLLLIQRKARGGKQTPLDSWFAGLIGGYYMFGNQSAVNEQVSYRPFKLCGNS
jgi:hypothetical protein